MDKHTQNEGKVACKKEIWKSDKGESYNVFQGKG